MPLGVSIVVGIVIGLGSIWVLRNFNMLAIRMQKYYIQASKKGGFLVLPPEHWDTPFFLFTCRAMMIFLGIWLLVVAVAVGFGGNQL